MTMGANKPHRMDGWGKQPKKEYRTAPRKPMGLKTKLAIWAAVLVVWVLFIAAVSRHA